MVAPQILVLIVGVRILLGEIELAYYWSVLFFLKSAASNIGLVRRPLKAERRVRLPWWLSNKKSILGFFDSYENFLRKFSLS